MILCSSREIASLKFLFKKPAGPPVYYSGSNEPSLAPQFKWPYNSIKISITKILSFFTMSGYKLIRCMDKKNNVADLRAKAN
jgi:hypothetical protein